MRQFFLFFVAVMALGVGSTYANPDLKDLLKGAGGGTSASDVLSGLGSVVNNMTVSGVTNVKDVAGTWSYVEPAVEFKSDNLLQKAGGAAASTTIVNKIKPIYEKAGIQNLQLTIGEDSSFSMAVGKVKTSGTIESTGEAGAFTFNFGKVAGVSLGKCNAYISKNISGQMTLTFDASKILSIVEGITKISGNSTVAGVGSLLKSYDGLTVGFVLKK